MSYATAHAACVASGKRLCTAAEFHQACGGAADTSIPYGDTYAPAACNGADRNAGAGAADVLLPTGGLSCATPDGVHDLSGNAKEWTDDIRGTTGPPDNTPIAVVRGGAYDTPAPGLTCDFVLSREATDVLLPSVGFRCCSSTAP